MTTEIYSVPIRMTTAQVNAAIKAATEDGLAAVAAYMPPMYRDVVPNREFRREFGRRRYVHGMGNQVRDTWVATFDATDHTLSVCRPMNYPGWANARAYTRARVVALDKIRSIPGLVAHHNYGSPRPGDDPGRRTHAPSCHLV